MSQTREPKCTSKRFGPRMFCYFWRVGQRVDTCIYCGLPPAPQTDEQLALIEASRSETWWKVQELNSEERV